MLPGMGMAAPMSLAAQGPFHPIAAVAAAAVGMGAKPEEKNDDRNSSRASRPRSSTPETSQKRVKVIFNIVGIVGFEVYVYLLYIYIRIIPESSRKVCSPIYLMSVVNLFLERLYCVFNA